MHTNMRIHGKAKCIGLNYTGLMNPSVYLVLLLLL